MRAVDNGIWEQKCFGERACSCIYYHTKKQMSNKINLKGKGERMKKYESWALACNVRRLERGLTWEEVAKKVGYTRVYIALVAHGRKKSDCVKAALCNYFGVEV